MDKTREDAEKHQLIGYFTGWVVRTLIHTLILVLVVKYAIATWFFTDALQDTKTCLEIEKLSMELSQEVISQTVIDICADLIQKEE